MDTLLMTAGIACVIAAIAGGGLKAFGIEIPLLRSVFRQVFLALLGILFILFALGLNQSQKPQRDVEKKIPPPANPSPSTTPPSPPAPVPPQRGWLGLQLEDLAPETVRRLGLVNSNGAFVAGIQNGSPAASQWLLPGDIIVSCNGTTVFNARQLVEIIRSAPGKQLYVQVLRNGWVLPGNVVVGAQ